MAVDAVIIGLGYVGLPLAQEATRARLTVLGYDINEGVVAALNNGGSHVDDLSDADVATMVDGGFRATTDESQIAEARVAVICVPTPLSDNGGPDLRAVEGAVDAVGRHLQPGMLVVLESTTYPGTTDEVVRPRLEVGGMVAGTDFHLAFSPERIDPGNEKFGAKNTPKVVGGHTQEDVPSSVELRWRSGEPQAALTSSVLQSGPTVRSDMPFQRGAQRWEVEVAVHTVELAAGFDHAGGAPAQRHLPVSPALDVAGEVAADRDHRLHRVGRPERPRQGGWEVEAEHGQGLGHPFAQAARGTGVGLVQLLGQRFGQRLGFECGAGVVGGPHPLGHRAAHLLGQVVANVAHLVDLAPGDDRLVEHLPDREDPAAAVSDADLTILVQNHKEYDVDALAGAARRFFDTRGVVSDGERVSRL